jgi:hypothetical protein
MTDQVLVMALPTETLRVGRDIPPRRRDAPYYPADLVFPLRREDVRSRWKCGHTRDRPKNPTPCPDCEEGVKDLWDIATRVRSLDRTVDDGRGSAARDWRAWDERINWALTLMRTRQHDETLFWRPYSEADQRRIVAGDLPLRSGDPSALEIQPMLERPTALYSCSPTRTFER